MAGTSQGWKRTGAVTAAGAAALPGKRQGSGIFALPAAAHTSKWSVTCTTVTVDLTSYNPRVTNTVSARADGGDLMGSTASRGGLRRVLDVPPHDAQKILQVIVAAGDGARWGADQTRIAPVCPAFAPPGTLPPTGAVAPSSLGAGP